jgi:thiol-disulfide isomerase/thioredoxin
MTKILIGKVYANWCGHCISLKPEWQRMKRYIKKYFRHIQFIEAESSQINKIENLKNNHNIVANGYPTLFKIQKNGEVEYYKGPRRSSDLIKWATHLHSNKTYRHDRKLSKRRTRSNKYYMA